MGNNKPSGGLTAARCREHHPHLFWQGSYMFRSLGALVLLTLSLGACADRTAPVAPVADAGFTDAAAPADADAPVDAAHATDLADAPRDMADAGAPLDMPDAADAADAGDAAADAADAADPGVRYYVSPSGDDAHPGTSPGLAWRSIERANEATLQPGAQLLFEGGQRYQGSLVFDAQDQGTSAEPIRVGTYGAGRATLEAGDGKGIVVYNTAGIEVSGFDVVGSGLETNVEDGVIAYVDLPGDVKLEHLIFDDLDVSGFGKSGVVVGADNGNSGFRGVRITKTRSHDNGLAGITVYGAWSQNPTGYAMEDVYIGHCVVHGNSGVAGSSSHSGNGIVIGGVDGGVIERSVAYNNGWRNTAVGGPIGIWAWDSNDITIQYNESYGNRTDSRADGGGFDLDGGVTNSVMQYNYSHDNDGAGFLLAQFSGASRPFANNIVRYNVSQNDGRRNGYGGIHLWTASSENANNPVRDISIYGNTVFMAPSSSGSPAPLRIHGGTRTVDVQIHNNLFVTTGGVPLAIIPSGQDNLLVHHNGYWPSGDTFKIVYEGKTYNSLQAFRDASGHELLGGVPVGLQADPMLRAPGGGTTIGDADRLSTLQAYQLQPTSPAIDAGFDLNLAAGLTDYYGNALPLGAGLDIGAHEAR